MNTLLSCTKCQQNAPAVSYEDIKLQESVYESDLNSLAIVMARRNEWSTSDQESPLLPLRNRARRRNGRGNRRKRDGLSNTTIFFIVCLGATSAFIFQPRRAVSDMASIAGDMASAATQTASGFWKNAGHYVPYSDVYDDIEVAWKRANPDPNSKIPHPITRAHKFASNKWYSEKLHPAGQGLRSTWIRVLSGFMKDLSISNFAEDRIVNLFNMNANNLQSNCVLVRVKKGRAHFKKTFPDSKHGRYPSVVYMIETILSDKNHGIPDFSFLVMLNDGHSPTVPTFGSARHWNSWTNLIPIPTGNLRGEGEGWGNPLMGWDYYIDSTIKSRRIDYPWDTKINRAVFRGALQMQTYKLGTCNAQNKGKCERANKWHEVNRGVMYKKAQKRPDLFDITFTKHRSRSDAGSDQMNGAPTVGESIPFVDLQRYKYLLNTGSNQDWAERLRSLFFMNSAVVMHQAETMEFFYPLIEPWRHIIPTNLMFTDLVRNIKWALSHDDEVQEVVQNMNNFAETYLSQRSMKMYWKLALFEYAVRQRLASGKAPDKIRGKEATATTYIPPHHMQHPPRSRPDTETGQSEIVQKEKPASQEDVTGTNEQSGQGDHTEQLNKKSEHRLTAKDSKAGELSKKAKNMSKEKGNSRDREISAQNNPEGKKVMSRDNGRTKASGIRSLDEEKDSIDESNSHERTNAGSAQEKEFPDLDKEDKDTASDDWGKGSHSEIGNSTVEATSPEQSEASDSDSKQSGTETEFGDLDEKMEDLVSPEAKPLTPSAKVQG